MDSATTNVPGTENATSTASASVGVGTRVGIARLWHARLHQLGQT